MIRRTLILLPMTLVAILLSTFSFSWIAAAGKDNDCGWSYSVKNGTEKSKRTYILVYAPATQQEKTTTVISQCDKPYPAEGAYGTCTHDVTVRPSGTKFNLNTGEDVVMVQFTWDAPLILATIEYGCCAGPDIVRFYTEEGKYIGMIKGDAVSIRAGGHNLIARTFNMGNGTRYGKTIYLLVQEKESDKELRAWVYEADSKASTIPVPLTVPDRNACEDWYVSDFVAYGDRTDMILKLKGVWCGNASGEKEQYFSCSASDRAISCHAVDARRDKKTGALLIKDSQKENCK